MPLAAGRNRRPFISLCHAATLIQLPPAASAAPPESQCYSFEGRQGPPLLLFKASGVLSIRAWAAQKNPSGGAGGGGRHRLWQRFCVYGCVRGRGGADCNKALVGCVRCDGSQGFQEGCRRGPRLQLPRAHAGRGRMQRVHCGARLRFARERAIQVKTGVEDKPKRAGRAPGQGWQVRSAQAHVRATERLASVWYVHTAARRAGRVLN